MALDPECMKLLAHIDQTRAAVRRTLEHELSKQEVARLVKVCAAGRFDCMDEGTCLLVGLLATVAIFDLFEKGA
ncbi:MAG: hypothetical protein IT445_06305 [Phycisphaeraceae bacterium]|nr:hypothetical protein [Phycisphaeraceae bacterium]